MSAALGAILALAGCASSSPHDRGSGSGSAMKMGSGSSSTTAASGGMGMASSSGGMSGGSMATAAEQELKAAGGTAAGIKPIPTQVLGTATWQGMKITAEAMTAVPFLIYNGTRMRMVKPSKSTSFHLMVMLNDAQTDEPIPYADVWATISRDAKVVSDEEQWPMISRYMGPHYGNNVSLPGAGSYRLSLLVTPPVSARHVEYEDVWLKPHRVAFTFHWKPES